MSNTMITINEIIDDAKKVLNAPIGSTIRIKHPPRYTMPVDADPLGIVIDNIETKLENPTDEQKFKLKKLKAIKHRRELDDKTFNKIAKELNK